jgi:hypothetical protein
VPEESPLRPPKLDYLHPNVKAPWTLRKKVLVSLAVVGGLAVLLYLGVCVTFVASNFRR